MTDAINNGTSLQSEATHAGSAKTHSDFAKRSVNLRIPGGATSATFTVRVRGGRVAEPTETFEVVLSKSRVFVGDGTGVGMILDND